MVDPDSAAPPRAMAGEVREDAARAEAPAASHVASTPLHGALQEKVASTDNGNRNDHEALRRRPTMWR
jgi:hypothetical protein